ncbi:hypothetical protein ACQ33O_02485 [Ferruginibacter sp. SUN002]|uniref:hypothetical protein n=1 Tax=Ferruginibacter sp. SUN002 TaxID=2937789 RepID=UPI003D3657B9
MRKFINLFTVLVCGFVFIGCTKDSDVFVIDPGQVTGPSDTWYGDMNENMFASKLQNALVFAADRDSIDMDNAVHTVAFPSGLVCTFPANAFVTSAGATVDGRIAVEAYLLKKKGDLIKMSRPTISDNRMLVNGGAVFIQGKKEGEVLKLANDKKIKIQFENNYVSQAMKLFDGDNTDPYMFNWKQCGDTISNNFNRVLFTSAGYEFYTNRLRWMNCNYFYDIATDDSVKISLMLPTNFTNANTLSFVVFNDISTVIKMKGSVALKKFISTALPSGKSVRIVTLTKEGNFYYLGHNGFVTSKSSADYQNININPARVSLEELKSYLDNL